KPLDARVTIAGFGSRVTLNAGQCITLNIQVRFTGTNTYVTVTNDPNSTFFTDPAEQHGVFTSKNVWCALPPDRGQGFPIFGSYTDTATGKTAKDLVLVFVNP
ncbi:MAG: hypothetical protein C5B55_01715, partial [Blastocatellia bacterium]